MVNRRHATATRKSIGPRVRLCECSRLRDLLHQLLVGLLTLAQQLMLILKSPLETRRRVGQSIRRLRRWRQAVLAGRSVWMSLAGLLVVQWLLLLLIRRLLRWSLWLSELVDPDLVESRYLCILLLSLQF